MDDNILYEWECDDCPGDDGEMHKWRIKELKDGEDRYYVLQYTLGDDNEWNNDASQCFNCDALRSLAIENKNLRAIMEGIKKAD